MNEHKYASCQLPICETLHVGINNQQNSSFSSSISPSPQSSGHHQLRHKNLIQDIRDQLSSSSSSNRRSPATHIIVRREAKQTFVLQSISLDSDDVIKYLSSSQNENNSKKQQDNDDDDFTITIFCQRAPVLCEPAEPTPIALCTLKPSAGIVSHHFENRSFHPRNGSVAFGVSVNLFAVVTRTKNISTNFMKSLKGEKESGKRRQREDEQENLTESLLSSRFTFKINILGYIAQPIERLVNHQLWRRLDDLAARHQLFEDEPSMRGFIQDDFTALRTQLAKRLHHSAANSMLLMNKQNEEDEERSRKGKKNNKTGRRNNINRRGLYFDDDDEDEASTFESDDDIRNLRDILNSDGDEDAESLVESDEESTASLVSSENVGRRRRGDRHRDDDDNADEQEEEDEDEDEEGEEGEEYDDDYDYDGFDDANNDEEGDDEEDEEASDSSDDVYYNEGPQRAWRYGNRREY